MCSYLNMTTWREGLARLNDMFKLLVEIHEQYLWLEDDYTEEQGHDDIDKRMFSFKHNVHNWLKGDAK